jgi:hypothetical protein
MTFLQAAGLGVSLFAVWLFLFTLQSLAVAFAIRGSLPEGSPMNAVAFAPAAITAFVGILLWMLPLTVARAFVPRGAEKATTMTLREAWRLGSVLIGLLVLAESGPTLLQAFAVLLFNTQGASAGLPQEVKADLVYAFAKTAFGLLLVFGSDHVYRRFGQAPPADPPRAEPRAR